MALWVCPEGTVYAVGLVACPQCGSTDHEEDSMPKISVEGGPSNALGQDPDAPFVSEGTGEPMIGTEHPADGTFSPEISNDPDEGGDPSAGTSSSTSSKTDGPRPNSTPASPPPPAPTTGSPSSPPTSPEPSSTAPTATSSTPATGSSGSEQAPPPVSAPKAVWAEHAVSIGAVAPEDAGQMTKAEIVETVNGGPDAEAAG